MNPLWLILVIPASFAFGFLTAALFGINDKEEP